MKHIFIINPAAGKKESCQQIYKMAEQLRQRHNLDVSCMLTRSSGHAITLARSLAETGEELRLYACGGDGTVNEVANGIAGFENAAMTVIPIGTGNDFLKNFGTDMEKFSDPENLWNGEVQQLDLIDCNGRYALTIACAGLDARVAVGVHKYNDVPMLKGKGSYIASLIVNFLFRDIRRHWTLYVDGKAREDDFTVITVCNGRYYGGGFTPVLEARMNDGILQTLAVRGITRRGFLGLVGDYAVGGYRKFPHIATLYTASEIRIHSEQEDVTISIDGECMTLQDVTFRLADVKLNFFGPSGCDPNATAR